MVCFRKTIIIAVNITLANNVTLRLQCAVLIVSVFLFLQLLYKPFNSSVLNCAEFFGLVTSWVTFTGGSFVVRGEVQGSSFGTELASIIVSATTLAFIVTMLWLIYRTYRYPLLNGGT